LGKKNRWCLKAGWGDFNPDYWTLNARGLRRGQKKRNMEFIMRVGLMTVGSKRSSIETKNEKGKREVEKKGKGGNVPHGGQF